MGGEIGETMSETTALQVPTHQPGLPMTAALVPNEATLTVYKTIATMAAESKYYQALGGMPGILSIMIYGGELGIPPMTSIQSFSNVHGHLEMSARLMNMRIRQAGHTLKIRHSDATKCVIYGQRADTGEEWEQTYTIEDARRAKLVKADGNWEKVPDDMCFARCISKLARRLFPDVIGNAYVEGEVREIFGDTVPAATVTEKPKRTRTKVQTVLAPEQPQSVTEEAPAETTPEVVEAEVITKKETTIFSEDATPAIEVEALLDTIITYLKETHHIQEGGLEYMEQLICEQFGVSKSMFVPLEKLEDLRKFAKGRMLQELQAENWLPQKRND
jgi:hypothetical protein